MMQDRNYGTGRSLVREMQREELAAGKRRLRKYLCTDRTRRGKCAPARVLCYFLTIPEVERNILDSS